MTGEDPQTGELKRLQVERARDERKREGEARDDEEGETHGRRAEKAEYLRQKLEERAKAEKRKLDEGDEGD